MTKKRSIAMVLVALVVSAVAVAQGYQPGNGTSSSSNTGESVTAGANITVYNDGGNYQVSGSAGSVTGGSSLGGGTAVFNSGLSTASTLKFESIGAGVNVSIFNDGGTVQLNSKPVSAGTNITLYDDGGTVQVNAASVSGSMIGARYKIASAQTLTSQTLTSAAGSTAIYGTSIYDVPSTHVTNPTTTSWLYTVATGEAGYYAITADMFVDQGAHNYAFTYHSFVLQINGTDTEASGAGGGTPGNTNLAGDTLSTVMHLNDGDTVRFKYYFDVGNNSATVTTASGLNLFATITRVAQ